MDVNNLPVFRKISLGTEITDAKGFRQAFKQKKMHLAASANDMLRHRDFRVLTTPTEVELVTLGIGEMGFTDRTRDIAHWIKDSGLKYCPPEVGPQLRLQYPDQPKGERLYIAMNYIDVGRYIFEAKIFCVENEDRRGLLLRGNESGSWNGFMPDARFVLVRPQSVSQI